MAISRNQPMRPALGDVLDAADLLRSDLTEETQNRTDADGVLQGNIDATNALLPSTEFTSTNTVKKYVDDADGVLQGNIDATNALLPSTEFTSTNTVKKYVDTADGVLQGNIDATNALLPSTEFTSTNTVKKYVDDADTEIKDVLPFTDFDSTNTVKKYVDDADTEIKDVLPFTDFDSTNTVKKYVDDLGTAIKEVIPFSSFDSTNTVKKYMDDAVSGFRIGKYTGTVAAGTTDTQSVTFPTPFDASADVAIFTHLITSATQLTVTEYNITNTGFTIAENNADTVDSATYTLVYIAIGA